jgi:A/G-specific adenine glycosylase
MKYKELDKKSGVFRKKLMVWHRDHNRREMPWKGEKDPYRVWLSEIILQQTRVDQGWAYYERFIKQFPTVQALAAAPEQAVLKCWEGLGYYSRCRNLISTARYIAAQRKGIFPNNYEEILQLKGVGPYTAAAIASFAFNLPHAVVDGNVYRVLARYHGIHTPIDSPGGKKQFNELAQRALDASAPGAYNQALMDFGATVCKPQAPLCTQCSLRRTCAAKLQASVEKLPVKSPPKPKRERWFYYIVPTWRGRIPLSQRSGKDVWEGLWEPPLIESDRALTFRALLKKIEARFPVNWPNQKDIFRTYTYKQVLSHQIIHGTFIHVKLSGKPSWTGIHQWVDTNRLDPFPFPKMIQSHWKEVHKGR